MTDRVHELGRVLKVPFRVWHMARRGSLQKIIKYRMAKNEGEKDDALKV